MSRTLAASRNRLNGHATKPVAKPAKRRQPAAKPANPYVITSKMTPLDKLLIAGKLTEMVGSRIKLEHHNNLSLESGCPKPSLGHIYTAYIREHIDDGGPDFGESLHVTIDDRLGDIRVQFIRELRRIAGVFEGMAKMVERQAKPVEATYARLGSYPTPTPITAYGVFLKSDKLNMPPILLRQCSNHEEAVGYRSYFVEDDLADVSINVHKLDADGSPVETESEAGHER